ncbi:MAG: hypothetical protein ACRCTE_14000 [Cellulosilyticaceae bacterium]
MKRVSLLVILSLLLVGCSKVSVGTTSVNESICNYDTQLQGLIEEAHALLAAQYGEDVYYFPNREDINASFGIRYQVIEQAGIPLSESDCVTYLESHLHGVRDFVLGMEQETEDRTPKSIVINQVAITMTPEHLYDMTDPDVRSDPYFYVVVRPIKLEDAYLEHLVQMIEEQPLMMDIPRVSGSHKMLSLSTPAYRVRSRIGILEPGGIHYEENAWRYQLYIEEQSLQKVRVIIKVLNDEVLDESMFEPLKLWAQSEWQMTPDEMSQLEEIMTQIIGGGKVDSKGQFGAYRYTYDQLPSDVSEVYKIKEDTTTTESIKEFVIEKH